MNNAALDSVSGRADFYRGVADDFGEMLEVLAGDDTTKAELESYKIAAGITEIAQGLAGQPAAAAVFVKTLQAGFRHFADEERAAELCAYGKKVQHKHMRGSE